MAKKKKRFVRKQKRKPFFRAVTWFIVAELLLGIFFAAMIEDTKLATEDNTEIIAFTGGTIYEEHRSKRFNSFHFVDENGHYELFSGGITPDEQLSMKEEETLYLTVATGVFGRHLFGKREVVAIWSDTTVYADLEYYNDWVAEQRTCGMIGTLFIWLCFTSYLGFRVIASRW